MLQFVTAGVRAAGRRFQLTPRGGAILAVAALFGFVVLSTTVVANTCKVGIQDRKLPVQLCISETTIHVGDTVTANGSVTNKTGATQNVTVTLSLRFPTGLTTSTTTTVSVNNGQTYSSSTSLNVTNAYPSGTYTLSGKASVSGGASSAVLKAVLVN